MPAANWLNLTLIHNAIQIWEFSMFFFHLNQLMHLLPPINTSIE